MKSAVGSAPVRPIQLRLVTFLQRAVHRVSGGRIGSVERGKHAPKGRMLKAITKVHIALYRATRGVIGGNAGGFPTLLLTTTGKKSGEPRTVALPFFERGEGEYLVIASYGGNAAHPAWYTNLVAEPRVRIQIKAKKLSATARPATAEERRAIWPVLVARAPMYGDYQAVTPREIPVVIISPT
jgi:deazaflavin-dependent oxidoreductase (nitroreductase family)